ncbi:MAG: FKBP-type peptidyl-prolyl cis-trans isomerase [Weeksellaceae bacterium]|nr:FKBP-type peptidyl-prolyl cis-trans isomerase [Weeksellaceae bacterium]
MKKFALLIIASIGFVSCDNQIVQYPVSYSNDDFMQRSQERGKMLLQEEIQWFEEYKKTSDLTFNKTESGLWISNSGQKTETMANVGNYVNFTYQVYDVKGNLIYPYSEIGTQKIILGKADIARGLHAALQLIEPGQEARVLLPSFLGYAGYGDDNKIEPNQPLILDVKVNEIKKH